MINLMGPSTLSATVAAVARGREERPHNGAGMSRYRLGGTAPLIISGRDNILDLDGSL
jgi:hypothetical protein